MVVCLHVSRDLAFRQMSAGVCYNPPPHLDPVKDNLEIMDGWMDGPLENVLFSFGLRFDTFVLTLPGQTASFSVI